MKFWIAKRVTMFATVVFAVGVAGCARHEVVASEPAMATPRTDEVSRSPTVMPDTPAPPMAQSTATMPATTAMETPTSSTASTYSSSTADANASTTRMDRASDAQPAPRVDRN
jgi:hypothetical protein